MDSLAQKVLDELEEGGLAEDTIVWFWGDHGRGLPRAKRWLYDSGMRIPLIVYVPPKYREYVGGNMDGGTVCDDLITTIDFAPTMLSLCGVEIPGHLQGKAFLGPQKSKTKHEYIFGSRDRIDEAYDMVRAVNDKRFKYIRNFMPYVPYAVNVDYMNQMPTMQELRRLDAAGELKGNEKLFMQEKRPLEELYDLKNDKYEVNNLAGDPKYRSKLLEMRKVVIDWMKESGDVGLIPECEFEEIQKKPKWREKLNESGRIEKVIDFRNIDFECKRAIPEYLRRLNGPCGWIRYWAVVGLHQNAQGEDIGKSIKALEDKNDESVAVKIAVAQALADWKGDAKSLRFLAEKLNDDAEKVRLFAANALDRLGRKAMDVLPEIKAAKKRFKNDRYIQKLLKYTVYRLENNKELFS